MRRAGLAAVLAVGLVALLAWQPEVRYVVSSMVREVRMLATARSVPTMLTDPSVPAEVAARLRFVQQVKAFGIARLGLAPSDSYRTYFDTRGQPLGWAVQAAWPDRLEPWLWHYPVLGSVPYKGFTTHAEADTEAAVLQQQGLETTVWPIPAYSTLGWLPDPVTSNLLAEEPAELGATILHELLHGTIYFPGQSNLNETMAQFVGEKGIQAYFPPGSSEARRATALFADETTFAGFLNDLMGRLQRLYALRLPLPQTLRQRGILLRQAQARFQSVAFQTEAYRRFDFRHLNNANLLGFVGYHDHLDWFVQAWDQLGTAPRLVAFLQRVSPEDGGMPAALEALQREGPDAFLGAHPVRAAPLARHTILGRWPWVLLLLILVALRSRMRLPGARWPWWVGVPCGMVAILVVALAGPWVCGAVALSTGVAWGLRRRAVFDTPG